MTLIEGVRIALLLTGLVVWYFAAVALLVVLFGVIGAYTEKRRTRKVLAAWTRMEDERRARREEARGLQAATWDTFVESRVSAVILDAGGAPHTVEGK